jgi:nucleoside-diphosphate-sugar epimerase
MKIIVVGGTGTIGSEVVKALEARHEVVSISRSSQPPVDYARPETITGLFAKVGAVDIEAKNGVRVNLVSPPWVTETLKKPGMTNDRHLSAAHVARAYLASVEGRQSGEIFDPGRF